MDEGSVGRLDEVTYVVHRSQNKIVMNTTLGHLLRTKNNMANEGGIAAGTGALDSPFLY